MAAKIQSRTSFEEHWSKDEHWLPRGDVQLPIDNELLYERLRAISNRTTPSRPLSKRQVGVATIRWLSRRTETSAQEYLDFYEGIASAQRFLQRRSAAAAAAAADAGAADAGADAPSADESMRASVAARFSPTAVQQRVDEALGPTPQVAELERLGISPREIAELAHAPLARGHLPTIWWLFRMGVRRALRARAVARTGSRRGWSESPAWALLCEMQRDAPEMQGMQRGVQRPLREGAARQGDAEEMRPEMRPEMQEDEAEMRGDAADMRGDAARQLAATPPVAGPIAASTSPRAAAPLLTAAPGRLGEIARDGLAEACEVRLPPCAYTVKVQNLGWRGRAERGEDTAKWYDSEGERKGPPMNYWRQAADERYHAQSLAAVDALARGAADAEEQLAALEQKMGIAKPLLCRKLLGRWAPVLAGGVRLATVTEAALRVPATLEIQRAGERRTMENRYGSFDAHLDDGEELRLVLEQPGGEGAEATLRVSASMAGRSEVSLEGLRGSGPRNGPASALLAHGTLGIGRITFLGDYLWVQRDAEGVLMDVWMRVVGGGVL